MVDGYVAGERVLGLAVLAALWAGVAHAGEVLGLQVLPGPGQVAANLVAEAAAIAALDFGAIGSHCLLQEVRVV